MSFRLTCTLCPVVLASLAPTVALAANPPLTPVPAAINTDTKLTLDHSPYLIKGYVTVGNNATLTIEHGVVVEFSQGATLALGGALPGFLDARGVKQGPDGTAIPDPVHFMADQPNPTHGYWRGIQFSNSQYRSVLDYCVISNAGQGGVPAIQVSEKNAPTITHCHLTWGDGNAVEAKGRASFTAFDNNVISHFKGLPMDIGLVAAGAVGPHNEVTDNGKGVFQIAGRSETDIHLTNNTVPFSVSGNLAISGETGQTVKLTLDPGVKLEFADNTRLDVGSYGRTAALIAQGTPEKPIVFTSGREHPAPGAWGSLNLTDCGSTILDHCIIEYAGANALPSVQMENGSPSITNTTVRNGGGVGIRCEAPRASFTTFKGNTITGMKTAPLRLHVSLIGNIDSENTLTGSVHDVVQLVGSRVTADAEWRFHGIPYLCSDNLAIEANNAGDEVTLTLDPGVHLLMSTDRWIRVGGGATGVLKAVGTAALPVVITSDEDQPAKGDWGGLEFNKSGSTTDLENVEINFAGKKLRPPVQINLDARGAMKNCTIAHSAAGGIRILSTRFAIENNNFKDVDGDTILKK